MALGSWSRQSAREKRRGRTSPTPHRSRARLADIAGLRDAVADGQPVAAHRRSRAEDAATLDARRALVGLESMSAYIDRAMTAMGRAELCRAPRVPELIRADPRSVLPAQNLQIRFSPRALPVSSSVLRSLRIQVQPPPAPVIHSPATMAAASVRPRGRGSRSATSRPSPSSISYVRRVKPSAAMLGSITMRQVITSLRGGSASMTSPSTATSGMPMASIPSLA